MEQIARNGVEKSRLIRRIHIWLAVVIAGLVVSGLTAFPLETEVGWFARELAGLPVPGLVGWLNRVHNALTVTNQAYPFLAYGTDWLAFAHLVIAVAFIGPWRDPVKNRWVVEFGVDRLCRRA